MALALARYIFQIYLLSIESDAAILNILLLNNIPRHSRPDYKCVKKVTRGALSKMKHISEKPTFLCQRSEIQGNSSQFYGRQ